MRYRRTYVLNNVTVLSPSFRFSLGVAGGSHGTSTGFLYLVIKWYKNNTKFNESLTQLNIFGIILNNSLRHLRDLGTYKKMTFLLIHTRFQ